MADLETHGDSEDDYDDFGALIKLASVYDEQICGSGQEKEDVKAANN